MSLIKSLASVSKPSEDQNIAQLAIYDVVDAGSDPSKNLQNGMALQYFPESISFDRNAEYASKKPIGGSHPLYQWIHGSERTLSFDVVFTAEQDVWAQGNPDPISSIEDMAQSVSNFLKNPVSSAINMARGGTTPPNKNHVDIPSALQWIQSKTYPLYQAGRSVKPPPKLAIHIPNAGIQTYANGTILNDVFYGIMTRCSVKLVSFFKSGAPRIAEASLSFEEIVQIGKNWGFVSRDSFVYNQATQKPNIPVGAGKGYNLTATYQGKPTGLASGQNNMLPAALTALAAGVLGGRKV